MLIPLRRCSALVPSIAAVMLGMSPDRAAADTFFVKTVAELHAALNDAGPGDEVVMQNNDVPGVNWHNANITIDSGGASGQPLVVRAQTPGSVHLTGASRITIEASYVTVTGLYFRDGQVPPDPNDSDRTLPAVHFTSGSAHNRLEDTAVVDYSPSDPARRGTWIRIQGTHNTVFHCHLEGKNHNGPMIAVHLVGCGNCDFPNGTPGCSNPNCEEEVCEIDPFCCETEWDGICADEALDLCNCWDGSVAGHVISTNYIADISPDVSNGREAIQIGSSSTSYTEAGVDVWHNYFFECDGDFEIITNKSDGNTYYKNTFVRCAGTLTLRHGNDATVTDNIFLGDGKADTGGVRVYGRNHLVMNNYFEGLDGTGRASAIALPRGTFDSDPGLAEYEQVRNVTAAYNTIVDCRSAFSFGDPNGDAPHSPRYVLVGNNVVQAGAPTDIVLDYVNPPSCIVYDANIMYGGTMTPEGIPGIERDANPLLGPATGGLQRPVNSSSAVIGYAFTGVRSAAGPGCPDGHSFDYGSVATDFDGQSRFSVKDAGCDEWISGWNPLAPIPCTEAGLTTWALPCECTDVPCALCATDLNGDDVTDVGDLVILLLGWGGPGGDVNGDGTTNVSDLVTLITAWGPC